MPPIADKDIEDNNTTWLDKLKASILADPTLTVLGYNDHQPTEPNIPGSEADAAS